MSKCAHLLSIEDSEADAFLLRTTLEAEGWSPNLVHVTTLEAGIARLSAEDPDLVLLDLGLPDSQGLDGLRRLQEASPLVPVVVVSGVADEALAIEAVRQGAQDFLCKHELDARNLLRSIEHARERKRLQTQISEGHNEQLRRKDMFLSHVSHEFRTPLSAIQQFASIMLDGLAGPLSDDQADYLGVVLRNVDELKRMVDDLLEATRATAGKLSLQAAAFEIGPVVDEALRAVQERAAEAEITLESTVTETRPVLGDEARVRQVLGNLVDNALKFTPPGGRVTVEACPVPGRSASSVLRVRDTGSGIPPAERESVFAAMFQSSDANRDICRKGLGLGLYICRELMELQGGRIWVEGEPGEGATFCAELPVYSLPSLLEPLCTTPFSPDDHVALVDLQLWHAGDAPRRVRGTSQLAALRRVVERCTTVDRDVLLPYDAGVRFVSRCPAAAPDVVLQRIRQQLHADAMLGGARFLLSSASHPLRVAQPLASIDELAEDMAAVLQCVLETDLSPDRLPEEPHP